MNQIPKTVAHYLKNYAPKGKLIGYWREKDGHFEVLVLYCRDNDIRFSVGCFPLVVGHWGHDLMGGDYDLEGIKHHLGYGLWDADESMKALVASIIKQVESGISFEEIRL